MRVVLAPAPKESPVQSTLSKCDLLPVSPATSTVPGTKQHLRNAQGAETPPHLAVPSFL